nr:hypothetical protein Iba_chr02dCG8670 [Ipomoea batatas]
MILLNYGRSLANIEIYLEQFWNKLSIGIGLKKLQTSLDDIFTKESQKPNIKCLNVESFPTVSYEAGATLMGKSHGLLTKEAEAIESQKIACGGGRSCSVEGVGRGKGAAPRVNEEQRLSYSSGNWCDQ